jgi:imidazolonepropionase-like amidohydrolase
MKTFLTIMFMCYGLLVHGQEKTILIKAGKLFDSEQKIFLTNQEILIQGNTIKEMGTNLTVPKETKIIDLTNYTVLPGLIDSHTHLLYLEPIKGDIALENVKMITMEGDALRTLRAYKRAKTFLDAGITTVKDLGNSGQFLDVTLKKAITEGTIDGPRLFVSGPIISSVGGQLPGINKRYDHLISEEYRIVKSVDDAELAVRENVTYGADLIKICADNVPNNTSLSIEQMKAIVETAHRYNKKVTAHAINARTIWEAIISGVDGIEHGYQLPDSTIALMSKKGVFFVPTDFSIDLMMRYSGKTRDIASKYVESYHKRLQVAMKENIKIVAGSDNYIDFKMPQGDAAKNVLVAYYESGMKPIEILISCTRTAAEFLDMTDKLGVIKKDAFADIIAVEGDLEKEFPKSIFQVRFVMADGKIYKDVK